MSQLDMISLALFCFQCGECCKDCNDNKDCDKDYILMNNNKMEVTYFYNRSDPISKYDHKIDENIHRIIFYNEYNTGFYESLEKLDEKDILIIYNKNAENVGKTIDYIYANKGLIFKNKKWIPKKIWIFN